MRALVSFFFGAILCGSQTFAAETNENVSGRAIEEIIVRGAPPERELLNYTTPNINGISSMDATEGWVHLKLALSMTGDVTDVEIVESYPKSFREGEGSFDRVVLKVAHSWKFQPPMKNGVALADPDYHVGVAFYLLEYDSYRFDSVRTRSRRGIDNSNMATYRRVLKALEKGDLEAGGKALEKLKTRYDEGDMNVSDIARYFSFLAQFERMNKRYAAALEYTHRTFMLAQFLDNGNVVDATHLEVIAALVGLGRFDDAVDYYDSWRRVSRAPVSDNNAAHIEALRAIGLGKGNVFKIVDFEETHRRRKTNSEVNDRGNQIIVQLAPCCEFPFSARPDP